VGCSEEKKRNGASILGYKVLTHQLITEAFMAKTERLGEPGVVDMFALIQYQAAMAGCSKSTNMV